MKTYKIKAFSELTSVTVRTLQHYDDIDLLKPTSRSESGYRLYSQHDLFRLQQIITLKFMGFNLKQISDLINKPAFDLHKSLTVQSDALIQESRRLEKAGRIAKQIAFMIDVNQKIDWDILTNLIEVINVSEMTYERWQKEYFTDEEKKQWENLADNFTEEQMIEYGKKWDALFKEVKNHVHDDPASKTALKLMDKWHALVDEGYGNTPELANKLWQAFLIGVYPKDVMPYFDQDVIDFIQKVYQHHKK